MVGKRRESRGESTENSPLLPKEQSPSLNGHSTTCTVESHGTIDSSHQPGKSNGGSNAGDVESQANTDEPTKSDSVPDMRKRLPYIFAACGIGVFLAIADQTIVVASYGKIGSDLQALKKTSWIATAYFLTLTSCQPLYGKLSDIFGRKACLIAAYLIFGLGCLCCGLANNIEQLICARAFAGVGGAGMTSVFSILLTDIVTLRERGKWQGYANLIAASAGSAGAPLGGFLSDYVGWRWPFLLQVPLCLVASTVVYFVLRLPKKDDGKWSGKLKRVDFLGSAILIAAVLTLLLGLDRGGNDSWTAEFTTVSLSASLILWVTFFLVEAKASVEPVASGRLIFNRSLLPFYGCNFFAGFSMMAGLFYTPLYYQAAGGDSASSASLKIIPTSIFLVSGSLFGGYMMKWTGRYYRLTLACYTGLTLGQIGLWLFTGVVADLVPAIVACMCLCAFCTSMGTTTTLIGLISNATSADQAVVTACSYLFRSLGNVIGISLSGTVTNQSLRQALAEELANLGISEDKAAQIANKVRESLDYLPELRPAVRAVVTECYAKAINNAFFVLIFMSAGALLSACFINEKRLTK